MSDAGTLSRDHMSINDPHYWIAESPHTRRQDAIGTCAEQNGGTPNCVPGQFSLCEQCSFSKDVHTS